MSDPTTRAHSEVAFPGSTGERELQQRFGTTQRAERFYNCQVIDRLNDEMHRFLSRMEMMFVSTSDSQESATAASAVACQGLLSH